MKLLDKDGLTYYTNKVKEKLNAKENTSNKVTSISSSSTDTQYPSAKCVYDSQATQDTKITNLENQVFGDETIEGEGTSLTLNNTLKGVFNELDLKGNTSQTGTPTPSSPIPVNVVSGDNEIVITGENVLNNITLLDGYVTSSDTITTSTGWYHSDYIDITDYNYYITTAYIGGNPKTLIYNENKTPIQVINLNQSSTIKYDLKSYANAKYIRISTTKSSLSAQQLIQGNTYNIDLPVEELVDKNNPNILNASFSNENTINSSANAKTIWVACKPNTTYIIKKIQSARFRLATSTEQPVIGGSTLSFTYDDSATSLTITTESNANYILVYYFLNGTDTLSEQTILDSISIANGSVVGTPIELCKIGNYQDYFYKDSDKWYLHKEIGKELVNVSVASDWAYINGAFQSNSAVPSGIVDISSSLDAYTNYFKYEYHASGITGNLSNGAFGWNSSKKLTFKIDGMTSKQNYIDWFTSNTTYVYYQLATPTTTEITYGPLIYQLEAWYQAKSKNGQTNISQINNDLPFIISASAFLNNINGKIALLNKLTEV